MKPGGIGEGGVGGGVLELLRDVVVLQILYYCPGNR